MPVAPAAMVRVLGPVEVDAPVDGVPLTPRGRRLLAALCVRAGATASVDWLVEAVWGDGGEARPPLHVEAALQTQVSRLRTTLLPLPGVDLLTSPSGYELRLEPGTLDAEQLGITVAQAAANPSARALDEALALVRGEPYAGLADAAFCEVEAARLRELVVRAQELRAQVDLEVGDYAAAVARLEPLARAHPLREHPHALLVRAQAGAGRMDEALRTHAGLVTRLREELGLDPSGNLQRLQADLLAGRLDAPLPRRAAELPRAPDLVGREHDLADLLDSVRQERMVTLLGPGGVGKTALALAAAHEWTSSSAAGAAVAFCELAAVPDGASLPRVLCTRLGVALPPGKDPLARLVVALADRDLLLVLDNCEHLGAQAAAVCAALLAPGGRLRLLTTSRIPLGGVDEQVVQVAPLVHEVAAVELFVRRGARRVRGYAPDEDERRSIATLCRRLDGLPLAIELAAGQLGVLTPEELLARLPWRLTVLRAGSATEPRHRTLRALVDWSYERLDPAEQRVFSALSVFAGPIALQDAEAVLVAAGEEPGAAAAHLVRLVDTSVVVRTDSGRLLVLETLRAFGRERLAAQGRADAVRDAHAQHLAEVADEGYAELYGPLQLQRLARLTPLLDELRSAYLWTRHRDPALAARLVGGLPVLAEHLLVGEVSGWAEELVDDLGVDLAPARVLALAASGARFGGRLALARRHAARAVERAGDDAAVRAFAMFVAAEAELFAGRLDHVVALRDEARLAAGERRTETGAILALLDVVAILAQGYAHDPEAVDAASELAVTAERQGWPVVAAWAGYVQGELLGDSDPARAISLLEEALRRSVELDERYLFGVAHVTTASLVGRHGDPTRARRLFGVAVRHWQRQGDWTHQWTTLRNVLDLLVRTRELEVAAVLCAALLDPGREAAGFGADAERLEATRLRLRTDLAPQVWEACRARGRALDDQRLVELVVSALDQGWSR